MAEAGVATASPSARFFCHKCNVEITPQLPVSWNSAESRRIVPGQEMDQICAWMSHEGVFSDLCLDGSVLFRQVPFFLFIIIID